MSDIDTEPLDKEEEGKPNWANFGIGISITIALILVIMIIGSLFLYTIKVGASNILPTDVNPENMINKVSQKIDANILREFSFHGLNIFNPIKVTSQKLVFNNINSTFQKIAGFDGGGFFGTLIDKMLSYNNLVLNTIGSLLNGWNENILILLSGIMYPIIFSFYFIFNWFFLFVDQFIEFAELLSNSLWIPHIFCYLIELLFCLPLIAIFSIIASIISIFTVIYSLLVIPFGYSTYNIQRDTKNNTFKRFFMDCFRFKTIFMGILFLFGTLINAQLSLGLLFSALFAFCCGIFIFSFDILKTSFDANPYDDSQTPGLLSQGAQMFLYGGKKLRIV